MMKALKVYFYRILSYCEQRYPKCTNLCCPGDPQSNLVIRSVLLYFYGLFLGSLFWKYVLLNVGLAFESVFFVGLIVSVFLGFGCALSVQMRCFSSLCLVGFLGKAGRSMLKAIVLTCILTGPINNISLNAREVVRVFSCSTILTYNLSKVRFDLMTKPFQNALLGSKDHLEQVKYEFVTLVNITEPIRQEIEGGVDDDSAPFETEMKRETESTGSDDDDDDGEDYRMRYKEKLRSRCKAQLEKGINRCRHAFREAYDRCHEKLPVVLNALLCWPLKIDFVCRSGEMFGDEEEICDAENVVGPNFGRDYSGLKQTEQELVGNLQGVGIQYEFVDMEQHEGYLSAKQTSKYVAQEFERKKKSFDLVVFILDKVFALIFVKVILGALKYHQNYLKNIDHENHFITDYFRHVDLRRARCGKVALLPLRRIEKPHLVDLDSASCTRLELRKIVFYMMSLLLQVIAATAFILMDQLFYETLDVVARHSRMDFSQQGFHDVNVTVRGTGVLAVMVRRSVEGFTTQMKVNVRTNNEECLPRPSELDNWSLVKIYLLFLAVAVLILNEAYVNRLRRFICSWFYRKREKQRILYLYNRMLRRRKGLQKLLIERLKEQVRLQKYGSTLGLMDRFAFYFPKWCGCISIIKPKSCTICGTQKTKRLIDCQSYNCFLSYCEECWQDAKKRCIACEVIANPAHDCCMDH